MFDAFKQKLGSLTERKPEEGSVFIPEPINPSPSDSRGYKISVAGYEIEGVSIAGQETCIVVPRAKVALDIGRCPQQAVYQQTVLISHGHMDHIGGLPFHVATRALMSLPPSKIVVHPEYAENLKRYLDVSNQLQGSAPGFEYEIEALQVGQEITLPSGFIARPFATSHTITSQGYLLYSLRKKLKAELQGKTQAEIREIRLCGQEVQDTVEMPEIAFTADTTCFAFEAPDSRLQDVFRAKLLIVEMTFVDDSVSVDEARERGHIHIADFIVHAHRFQNEAILLIHFSPRYKKTEIVNALNTWLPPSLRTKCVPFLNGYSD